MFFGLLQYIIQGRKTLDGVGTTPPNPLTTEERKGFIRNLIIALVVIAAVFGGAQLTGHLTIDFCQYNQCIGDYLTVVLFIKMLTSKM